MSDESRGKFAKAAANLIIHELLPRLKRARVEIEMSPVTPWDMQILAAAKSLGVWSTHEIRKKMDERFAEYPHGRHA